MATAVAVGALSVAGTAGAVTVNVIGFEAGNLAGPLQFGSEYIYDFDTAIDSRFSFSPSTATNYVSPAVLDLNGYGTLISGVSAPPPIPYASDGGNYHYEDTDYYTILGGGSATLTALGSNFLTGFSFYFGSPDEYNDVTFTFTGAGGSVTLSGEDIWTDEVLNLTGNQGDGRRVYYNFGGDAVKSITFASSGNSFEIDGLAANVGAVPEPGTWALMIGGFGGAGAMLRRRRALTA